MARSTWSVAVVGPGGVGGLLGALISRAGHPVFYIATPATVASLGPAGLSVRSAKYGDFNVPATAGRETHNAVDLCLVTVKATGLDLALAGVRPEDLGDGLIVPLLNGIEHMDVLRARFPAAHVVAGTIRVESTRVAPWHIEHTSPFSRIEIASNTAPRERVDQLAAQLRQAGLDVVVRDDEATMLWDKLSFLAPLALLTTHTSAPVGVVREERRAELQAVIGETVSTAAATGVNVDPTTILRMFDEAPVDMKSSMQRDAEAKRPTELDAIGGAVLRTARRHGLDTPVTERIVNELQARESGSRGLRAGDDGSIRRRT